MYTDHVPTAAKINLWYVVPLASTAALGGLLFGFDIAIITGAGPFLTEHFGLSDLSLGIAFSSLLFGCILGSFAAGQMADRYGRRRVLLWAAIVFILTSIGTGLASNFTFFLVARFLGGLAVGAASMLSPMYVAEVSPAAIRGRMGTLYQLSIVVGILLSYAINYLLRNSGPENWRWMFITGAIPAAIFFLLLLRAPETPRFLMMRGCEREAFHILERIAGRACAEAETAEIRESFLRIQGGWSHLLAPGIKRAVFVGFFLAVFIQVSGINTIIDYAPGIFKSAGWNMDAALFSTFVVGLVNLIATLASFWMIDRFGRKPLYITGSLGMCAALLTLTVISSVGAFHGWLVLGFIFAYLVCFSSCVGPVFWTLVPEIFPNSVRGIAMTVPVLTQWVANAIVVLFFPLAFHQAGKTLTFAFLGIVCLLQGLFTWRFLPETKNKTLEEVAAFWGVGTSTTSPNT